MDVFNILLEKRIVNAGFKLTMSAAFTAEGLSKPKKKKILNPKSPIKPVSEIPFRFFRIVL